MALPYVIDPDTLVRGESFRNVYTIQDTDGDAVDVSSVDIGLRLRKKGNTGTPLWDLTCVAANEGEYVTDGTNGQCRFLRSQTNTDALSSGKYNIEITYADSSTTPATFRVWGTQDLTVLDPDTGDFV